MSAHGTVTLDTTIRQIMNAEPGEEWTAAEIVGNWYTLLVIAEPVLAGVLHAHELDDRPERGELVALVMLAHRALALFDAEETETAKAGAK